MTGKIKSILVVMICLLALTVAKGAFAATEIFRSVGPSNTATLATDISHVNTVTITSGVATFSSSLANNIGVGDAVIIDTGGTDQIIDVSDTLLFIHGRTDSTHYTLRTHTGVTPGDIASNDTYSIYRAYTSLFNAEAGTKNTSIPIAFNGGDCDLVINDEQWNIACYGDAADTDDLDIRSWTTKVDNYLKIYTPASLSEVGVSQKHAGKWDDGGYRIENEAAGLIAISINNVEISGLQISLTGIGGNKFGIYVLGGQNVKISNNIIKKSGGTGSPRMGIAGGGADTYAMNNIVYGFNANSGSTGISFSTTASPGAWVYNNTVYDCYTGINTGNIDIIAKNNITQNCTNGYNSVFDATSDHNISDIAGDAPNATFSGGEEEITFASEISGDEDFHLARMDETAIGGGEDLGSDYALDIDGEIRVRWDIGADEMFKGAYKPRGNLKMRGDVNIR